MRRAILTVVSFGILAWPLAAQTPPASPPTQTPPSQATPAPGPTPSTGGAPQGATSPPAGQAAPPSEQRPPVLVFPVEQVLPGVDASRQWRLERLGPNHWRLSGDVEIQRDDVQFYADEMEIFTDTHLMTAQGNVVFATATHRISADRVEFNLQTQLGTFFNASGTALMGDTAQRTMFGSQEPEIYFYGETIEKIGERKYRLTRGGFTACVQPRPRWEMTSGSVVLNLDHYALLTNSVLKVKGVPMLYLPAVYYPIDKDGRSTGFLVPTYGSSSIRGHTISNAFFLALGRSHDATLTYDWFSKTGQAYGTEYRYVASNVSRGDVRFYGIAERPVTTTGTGGTSSTTAGRRSYEIRGNVSQALPWNLKARGRADYFSDLTIQQTYQQNIYYSSRRQRLYSGNLNGVWGPYTLNASFDRSEVFFNQTNSTMSGSQPRLSFAYAERPVLGSIVYASVGSEFASMVRQSKSGTTVKDLNINRLDVSPMIRVPFNRWPFLTINSTVAWRYTWWNDSLSKAGALIQDPVARTYFDLQARVVGPVFNRIWNTNSGYAEKIKHSIEPFVNLQRVTYFDMASRIVGLDGTDYVVPGVTKISYGVANRFYAKPPAPPGKQSAATEFINVMVSQSYYTDARASQVDANYASSFQGRAPTNFSPVSLAVRSAPLVGLDVSLRTEYDVQYQGFRTTALQGSYSFRDWLVSSGAWSSSKYFTPRDPKGLLSRNQALSGSGRLYLLQGRVGGDVSFNYDIVRDYFIQRRITGFYHAQCCGFAVEFQTFNFGRPIYLPGYALPLQKDRRFNISITLAGLTTFSNFLGAFGGNTQTGY